jgi:hypothetical protein
MMGLMPLLRPAGCPIGVKPAEWRRALEQRIDQHAAVLSTLIDALDAMDGDCDLEVGGDEEPWLGWIGSGPSQYQSIDDREIDESAVSK